MHLKPRQRTVSSVTRINCKMIFPKHYFLCLMHVSQIDRSLPEASWEETGSPSSQMKATSSGLHVLGECRGTGLQCSWVMLCFGPCQAGFAGDPGGGRVECLQPQETRSLTKCLLVGHQQWELLLERSVLHVNGSKLSAITFLCGSQISALFSS